MVNWRQLGIRGKRKLRNTLRALKGQPRPEIAVQHCLAPVLAPMACIDVGASFGIHRPWELFLHSPNVLWLAVEPNSTEADYLKSWPYPAQLQRCNEGLSGTGGERTLYITHNPNGSSILQPRIPTSIQARSNYEAFFYPLREIKIATITLSQLLERIPEAMPFVIKLDTQGSELEILQSGEAALLARRCVGIELEASLLAEPPYTNAARFWQINGWLENLGFELMRIAPICFGSRHAIVGGPGRKAPAECDAIFTLRTDRLSGLPASHRLALMAFLATNGFYEEAHALLAHDRKLQDLIQLSGGDSQGIEVALRNAF